MIRAAVRVSLALLVAATSLEAQEVGPSHGALVVVGGAMRDPAIFQRFVELAGGPDARIIIIPTAGGAATYDTTWSRFQTLRQMGALTNARVLHTYDSAVANTEAFAAPFDSATGVWFAGGRQWRLADAYLATKVERALWRVLERGGAIGGSSAGATIQGSYLVRGDTKTNTIVMGDHEKGFGFLRNVGIDQHVLRRNREFDLIAVVETHPELLGLGIDENTAIVVQGDTFDVIGHGYVAVYDHHRMLASGGRFYLLAPGDHFDLAARRALRNGRPLGIVVDKEWPDSVP